MTVERNSFINTCLLVVLALLFLPAGLAAQSDTQVKRVVVLHWDNKDFPGNNDFDDGFQSVLKSIPGNIEYYPEYLDSNRFPGENQIQLLYEYLRQKYADLPIDVVVATPDPSLDFLLKYRADLFKNAPIVYLGIVRPQDELLTAGPGLTGLVRGGDYKQTLGVALKLQPDTQQVFVISGTPERDKKYEMLARHELSEYEERVSIHYLTDLPLSELISTTKNLPSRSIILYLWHRSANEAEKTLQTSDFLSLLAPSASVPVYASGIRSVGTGIVGGYIWDPETNGRAAAEIVRHILSGRRAQDIPVDNAAAIPTFDWRQLQRWGISESSLPAGSVVRFKEPSFWQRYQGRIIGVAALVLVQTLLIAALLFQRNRRRRAANYLALSEERYRNVVETQTELIYRYLPDTTLTFVNDAYCRYFGRSRAQLIGAKFIEFIPKHEREAMQQHIQSLIENRRTAMHEHEVLLPQGGTGWQQWVNRVISPKGNKIELQGVGRDITERKLAERALRETEERNRAMLAAIPDLMFLQNREGEYLDYHTKDLNRLLVSPETFMGRNMREFLPAELSEKFFAAFASAIETGETQVCEYDLKLNDEQRWFEARIAPCNGDRLLSLVRDITERKRAEEALTESEEFNRQIVESSPDCIKILDLDGNLRYMNKRGQQLLEIDDIRCYLGGSWIDMWGDQGAIALRAINRARNGGVGAFQAFRPTVLGKPRWWHVVVTPIHNARGDIEHLLSVSRDITEQRMALEAVREGEERFEKAFKANPQPMTLTTLVEGKYLDVNQSFLDMSGYTRDEVIGHTSNELAHFDDPGYRLIMLVEPLLRTGVVRNFELKFRTKSGCVRTLLSSAELLELGSEKCILVASSDITERKALEHDLRRSEREFSTLVENSPDIISRLDRDLSLLYISPGIEKVTGMRSTSLIGRNLLEFNLEGFDEPGFGETCREAFNLKKTVHRAFTYRDRTFFTRIIPELGQDGEVESLMTISEDVTERIRSEQELLHLTAQLFRLQDEERRKIARDLHDGTAQNLFAISLNLAKLGQLDSREKVEMNRLISETVALGDESLQEIRTMSYLLHPPLLDQVGLVSALQWYAEGFSKRSGISVDVFAQPMERLSSDLELALFRIVQESLTNVRRHSGSATASIKLEKRSGTVYLEIRDRGRGLQAAQASEDRVGFAQMGVGIPGMRQRLRQLGGQLEVVSDEHGATVTAVVPLTNGATYYRGRA